jgi:hypothetical protein
MQLEKEAKSKFKQFLSFEKIFQKKQIEQPLSNLEKQASLFLNTSNYTAYVKMLTQGYQPRPEQENIFEQFILSGFTYSNANHYIEIEKLLETGYQLSQKTVLSFFNKGATIFTSNSEFFKNYNNLLHTNWVLPRTYPKLSQQMQYHFESPEFSMAFFKQFINEVNKPKPSQYLEYLMPVLQNKPEIILKHLAFNDFMEINQQLQSKEIYDRHKTMLNNIVNTYYAQEVEKIMSDTKANYAINLVKTLTLENIKKEQHHLSDIPKEANNIIESIENIYKKIQSSNHTEDLHQLNILLEKRIPEILTKYLTIDPTYRTTLTNIAGKNAQQLMIESLSNIQNTFNNTFENINQNHVNSLSATNRYTKTLK